MVKRTHRELDEGDLSLAQFCLLIVSSSGHPWSQPLHQEHTERERDRQTDRQTDRKVKDHERQGTRGKAQMRLDTGTRSEQRAVLSGL